MRGRWTLAVGLCLAATAGCTDDVDAGKNAGAPVRAGDRYVALGDSYTAGGLLGTATGEPACVQSDGNYPNLLATALDLRLEDVSCGGAVPGDLEGKQNTIGGGQVPPQLDAVTASTDLVTLSIGANHDGLIGNIIVQCVALAASDPTGRPCADAAEASKEELEQSFATIAEDVEDAIDEIIERAPDARVIVVGYPQIFPADGSCPELPLATGDYGFARDVMNRVTVAMEKGAREARAEYVDMWSATEGHDICGAEPWIAGAAPAPGRPGYAYHPYAEEQRAVADRLIEQIADNAP